MAQYLTFPLTFLLIGVGACSQASSQGPAEKTQSGCRFIVPDDLAKQGIRWIGPCRKGRANGLGVIRTGAGNDIRLFAGKMDQGRPVAGYFDTPADTAGPSLRFKGAQGLPTRNQAEARQACVIAADGAANAAAILRQEGNNASATFYTRWSQTLRKCMDQGAE